MAYITPIHRPCGTRLTLKLNLMDPDDECLVIAKFNRIELYQINTEAADSASVLELVASQSVYGRITILNKFRPADSLVDHLFIGTDQAYFFTAQWNSKTRRMDTGLTYIDLADKTAREVQTGERSHIDPTEEFMLLEVYEGILTTIPLAQKGGRGMETKKGVMGTPSAARIAEYHVKSAAFIQRPRERPRVALLWEDYEGNSRLKFRDLDYTASDQSADWTDIPHEEREREYVQLDLGASHLVPVLADPYGIIVLAETSVLYVDDSGSENHVSEVLTNATIWTAWARIDNQRYVLADEYGKLYLMMLQIDSASRVTDITVEEQGATSQAACLVYLDNGLVFVGSHHGDSQVIRLQQEGPQVVQTLANLAPILDFTVMDMGNRSGSGPGNEYSTGQARIVTGSGSWRDGSIRSVRSGVGVEVLALLPDFEHVTNIFSIKVEDSLKANALLISFADETRMLGFSPTREVQELDEYKGILLDDQTLLAKNTRSGRLLQVTRTTVKLLDLVVGKNSRDWSTKGEHQITSASANDHHLAICIGGQGITVFEFSKGLTITKQFDKSQRQISCVALSPLLPSVCFVGYWGRSEDDGNIDVLSLADGRTLKSIELDEGDTVIPRKILLSRTNTGKSSGPTMFVSLADGHVVTCELDGKTFATKQLKSTILGTREAELEELTYPDGHGKSVFVASEHPSLIYNEDGRMTFSAVDAEQINCVCSFESDAFPNSVVFATANDIKIGRIDYERTTHVQPLQIGETARRLAYSRALKAFGIGTIRRAVEDGAEVCYSSFQLVDEVMFKKLDSHNLKQDTLVEAVMRTELDDGYGQAAERFIVGTSLVDTSQSDEFHGQILVFDVTDDRKLRVIAQHRTKGSCRCLGMVKGRIVAGLNKTVAVFAYEFSSTGTPSLNKVATYRTSTMPIAMCITNDEIAVADLMKSVSILQYKAADKSAINLGKQSLTEIARHYQTFWSTAVTKVDSHSWLESDAEGNVIVVSRNLDGATAEDRRRLQVDSEFRLGELVNKMQSIDVEASPNAPVIPRAFLATREGSLYLFGFIASDKRDLLINLQERLASRVVTLGNVPFMGYRAFRNDVRQEDEPRRFVDGELVERFLDCPPDMQAECVRGLSIGQKSATVEAVRDIVDNLRRMH